MFYLLASNLPEAECIQLSFKESSSERQFFCLLGRFVGVKWQEPSSGRAPRAHTCPCFLS